MVEVKLRNPEPSPREHRSKPATGHLPREDAGAGLYRRERGDGAAQRRLRGCAVTIPDASKPFAPSPSTMPPMDSITQITIADNIVAGSDTRPTVDVAIESQPLPKSNACVHFEHTEREVGERGVRQAEPATPAVSISSYRLLVCLSILGWSERDLARRTGRHQTTIVRWVKGLSPVPGEEAARLETLATFHMAHPAPWATVETNTARSASSRFLLRQR